MKLQNYLKIRCLIPFISSFCYIDSKDYICDEIFYNHGLKHIYFSKKEFYNKDTSLIIVRCYILSKDITLFVECMEHLRLKLEFLDYDMEEYDKIANAFTLVQKENDKN